MAASATAQVLSPGDVLGFPIERIGRFGACQILATNPEKPQVAVAVLDWTGEHMPTLDDVADVPPLVKDFMFWQSQEITKNVPLPAPSHYRMVGTLPVRGATESRSYGDWNFDDNIARQQRWNALPRELTAAFKASLESKQTVAIPGLVHGDSGECMEMRLGAARRFSDDAAYRITSDFRMASLQAWPALYQIFLEAWREDLLPFLQSSPLVSELSLIGHGQREIDLSRTHLDQLTIDIDGLERLVLPDSMAQLTLRGKGVPERLQVVAVGNGRWISVRASGTVPSVRGLEGARGLRLDSMAKLDLGEAADIFPGVEYLHVFGAPGMLTGLAALSTLPKLEALWLCDLFGYGPEEFPAPGQLPTLTSLSLDSLPADVAAAVRKAYKKASRVDLSVSKPRAAEWLEENLENPLRQWDGREGMSPTVVKKTRTAFVAALRNVRAAEAIRGDDAAYAATVTGAVSDFLDVIAALNRKHGFLYTLERDEVVDAVGVLTRQLSQPARVALDPILEKALDD